MHIKNKTITQLTPAQHLKHCILLIDAVTKYKDQVLHESLKKLSCINEVKPNFLLDIFILLKEGATPTAAYRRTQNKLSQTVFKKSVIIIVFKCVVFGKKITKG